MMSLVYNERSWAIDLISELNSSIKDQNTHIARASGEAGIKNSKGFLFPDVILYGRNANILMGWELKMPDTPIEDVEFKENAKKKANLLGTNSFLLWNGRNAKLYARKDNDFVELKSWSEAKLPDRKSMGLNREYWIRLLGQIVRDLEFFFASGEIPASKLVKILDENFIVQIIDSLYREDADAVRAEYQRSAEFRIEFDIWSHENEISDRDEAYNELAKLNILSWINRLIFSHYLALKTPLANSIFDIKSGTTVEEALLILDKITSELDYSQIYKPGLGNDLISSWGWSGRVELNEFLVSANLQNLPDEIFRKVLDNFAESSKRKVLGQYATPRFLALLLVRLTIDDARANFLDPCVGSGTIIKQAYGFKKELGISAKESFKSLWASDKYQFPLQITTLNLVDSEAKNNPLQIFKRDVFDLSANQLVDLVDPTDFRKSISKSLPLMGAIVSNLPFIRFESNDSRGPSAVAQNLFEETNFPGATKLGRADIYATIVFKLWELLEDDGNLGVVVSNSWMGTTWGGYFQELIRRYFTIKVVIRSGNSRWFKNADVVTNLLLLQKKYLTNSSASEATKFATTLTPISEWSTDLVKGFVSNIYSGTNSKHLRIKTVSNQDENNSKDAGYSVRANFFDCSWAESFVAKSLPISSIFEVARGARRGWNPLFYPETPSTIEAEFLIPALKTTSTQTQLVAEPDSVAFCCEQSIEVLKRSNKKGALNWLKTFESQVNGQGKPLPEVLAQTDFFWYQMSSKEKANFVVSMNPYENLSVLQLEPPAFVDQRLIRINPLPGKTLDLELLHAILNCSLSLVGIELLGFERGLGVLDISASLFRDKFRILDYRNLESSQIDSIKESFSEIKSRKMLPTLEEIKRRDRQELDSKILSAFGLNDFQDEIYRTLELAINERVMLARSD